MPQVQSEQVYKVCKVHPGLPPSSLGTFKEEDEPLLDFLYEKKPFSSRADHKVHVKSQPLDIVFNPIAIKVVSEFFKIPDDLKNLCTCHKKSEGFRKPSREEFTRNINHIIEGNYLDNKVCDIMLDLSALKLLIPDHFEDKNAALIVIDFGKLMLSNRHAFSVDSVGIF